MQNTVIGGETAIKAAHALLSEERRGDPTVPELTVSQIREQLGLGVDRVMCEGSLYDEELAALAIKQAQCDLIEAIHLIRAFRTTLRRFGISEPIQTSQMLTHRRIATTHKEPSGGQYLGATYDYTHRLLDFNLLSSNTSNEYSTMDDSRTEFESETLASPLNDLREEDLVESFDAGIDHPPAGDLTRERLSLPAHRDLRLQALARADEGFLTSLVHSSMRGLGSNHPYISDLRTGDVEVYFLIPELGFTVSIGIITVTTCQTVHETSSALKDQPPRFTSGYGIGLGRSERKAISAAVVDRALRSKEMGEACRFPVQDEEFVLLHSDAVVSSGQVHHLKLPHYVDFQAQLQLTRELRLEHDRRSSEAKA